MDETALGFLRGRCHLSGAALRLAVAVGVKYQRFGLNGSNGLGGKDAGILVVKVFLRYRVCAYHAMAQNLAKIAVQLEIRDAAADEINAGEGDNLIVQIGVGAQLQLGRAARAVQLRHADNARPYLRGEGSCLRRPRAGRRLKPGNGVVPLAVGQPHPKAEDEHKSANKRCSVHGVFLFSKGFWNAGLVPYQKGCLVAFNRQKAGGNTRAAFGCYL